MSESESKLMRESARKTLLAPRNTSDPLRVYIAVNKRAGPAFYFLNKKQNPSEPFDSLAHDSSGNVKRFFGTKGTILWSIESLLCI